MCFLNWFDRFLMILMVLFALLTFAGIFAGFVTPHDSYAPFVTHLLEWLADTSADFANTWAIILVAMGADRFAVMERDRAHQKEKLALLGKLELLFYPVHFPFVDSRDQSLIPGRFPKRSFEKLLEMRPAFLFLFPGNKVYDRLISLLSKADHCQKHDSQTSYDILFESEEIAELIQYLTSVC